MTDDSNQQFNIDNINFPGDVRFSDEDFVFIEELVEDKFNKCTSLLNKIRLLREGLEDDQEIKNNKEG